MLPPRLGALANRAIALRAKVAARFDQGAPRRDFWRRFFFGAIRDSFLADQPAVVSVMWVNNETGVVQDIEEIAGRCNAAMGAAPGCLIASPPPVSMKAMEWWRGLAWKK